MKSLLILAACVLLSFASCRYSQCTDPSIDLAYTLDSTGVLVCEFNTYEKGTGFSKLLSSDRDSIYEDTGYYNRIYPKHSSVDGNHDYIITIPETGKTYKISDISYSGQKKVQADGLVSENKTKCTRTVSYTVNGEVFTIEGSKYYYSSGSPKQAIVTISK